MLTRDDLVSSNRQDKNAGNSGDLIKHISYLALIRELRHRDLQLVEAHGGKGVYVATHRHLFSAQQNGAYSGSTLGIAQAACFAPPPSGFGAVLETRSGEVAYAGSGALHAFEVLQGRSSSLCIFDSDRGVRDTVARVFSESCFTVIRPQLKVHDPGGQSEPVILSKLRDGTFGGNHVLHLDPFAFVMAQSDAPVRAIYRDLVWECDARVGKGELAAASVFFTWGSNGAAAAEDLFGTGYLGGQAGGYQDLVSLVHSERRVIVRWCWELFFALLIIVPRDVTAGLIRAIESDAAWLAQHMRRFDVVK